MKATDAPPQSTVRHRIFLRSGRESSILGHHPWIFTGAVLKVESLPGAEDGDVCDVFTGGGEWLARGTLHRSSQIICRILTWKAGEAIDAAFFRRRFEDAIGCRRALIDPEKTDAYRLVNAEGDRLPGLIVDRYGDHLVVQVLTSGMARLEETWCAALEDLLKPSAIIDRTEHALRDPSLSGRLEAIRGSIPDGPVWVSEDDLRFRVNLMTGQKTGFYIDQRENRFLCGRLARGRDVLNGFAYTGAFGIHAARGGARHVIQLESSAWALDEARVNWTANGLPEDQVEYVRQDLFRFLRRDERLFDMIVLDPPPYAKTQGAVERAARAYKDLNLWAMRRLRPGGLLMSFSCSQHVSVDLFQKILFAAAKDAPASCQWLARLGAAPDHPVHLDHPQGEYLKGFLLRLTGGEEPLPASVTEALPAGGEESITGGDEPPLPNGGGLAP
jgi:23S rRNA (cytosine1962-C5)-methyltransferase